MESEKLLPCPFCGGDGDVSFYARTHSPDPAGHFVECLLCAASGQGFDIQGEMPDRVDCAKAKAIAAWNTRAPADLRSVLEAERCSICGGKSFAAVDVRQFDGTYAPGPERRCVECKTTFTAQAFAALAPTKGDVS